MHRSRPRPDVWPPEGDPRRISAADLDAAIAIARLRFGTEARVVAARQVRRGVPGLGGKVTVEVWVESPSPTVVFGEPEAEADATIEALLARADAADTVAGVISEPPPAAPAAPPVPVPVPPHPAPEVVADPLPPRWAGPDLPRQRTRRWSKAALSRLGVPGAVLTSLTVPDEPSDVKWIAALAGAIAAALPEPCLPGVAVAHGTGGDGALMLLRTGLAGVALGTLTTASGPSPATPVALAAAIGELL